MNQLHKTKQIMRILLLGIVIWVSGQTVQAAGTQDVEGTQLYDYAYQVVDIVNQERAAAGLNPVTMDEELLNEAMLRAAEIVVSFSHTRPNDDMCFTVGAWGKVSAENIARGQYSPVSVMSDWMNSQGHKDNIMTSEFKSIGVGCMQANGTLYWVQLFGGTGGPVPAQPANMDVRYRVACDKTTKTTLISSEPVKADNTQDDDDDTTVGKVKNLKIQASSKGKLTVKWKKAEGDIDGYKIQISASRSFSSKQTYTVKRSKLSKTITKYNGKKLKSGKKYYVRVRAYTKKDGATFLGDWSVTSKKLK